jgi:hypothetical protein
MPDILTWGEYYIQMIRLGNVVGQLNVSIHAKNKDKMLWLLKKMTYFFFPTT